MSKNECKGSDQDGEPNGYGCPDLDSFIEENQDRIKE